MGIFKPGITRRIATARKLSAPRLMGSPRAYSMALERNTITRAKGMERTMAGLSTLRDCRMNSSRFLSYSLVRMGIMTPTMMPGSR